MITENTDSSTQVHHFCYDQVETKNRISLEFQVAKNNVLKLLKNKILGLQLLVPKYRLSSIHIRRSSASLENEVNCLENNR